ncbi:MAG: cyclic-di-AMP receptor [Tissierellia bacterium]|nr:cyclic-di-AMP receptor [Tissierellia bacterium]
MKLVFAIIQDQDTNHVVDALTVAKFRVTKLSSSGGFLKSGNTTLLMGVEDERLDELMGILERESSQREVPASVMSMNIPGDSYMPYPFNVQVGGATIFILDVQEYLRY